MPLGEDFESYEVDILDGTMVKRTLASTAASCHARCRRRPGRRLRLGAAHGYDARVLSDECNLWPRNAACGHRLNLRHNGSLPWIEPRWLACAWDELGQREIDGSADNPRILAYFRAVGQDGILHDEVPWCAAFVGACLERAGNASTRSLMARST